MAKGRVFAVATPLGHRVVLRRDRWREITRYKHPAMAGHEADVRDCLSDPDVICESVKDASVHLYYRRATSGYVGVVVGGDDPQARFVISAYFTRALKKGNDLWTR